MVLFKTPALLQSVTAADWAAVCTSGYWMALTWVWAYCQGYRQ